MAERQRNSGVPGGSIAIVLKRLWLVLCEIAIRSRQVRVLCEIQVRGCGVKGSLDEKLSCNNQTINREFNAAM